MLKRIEVERDHIGRFRLELRIGARDIALEPMRLEPGALSDAEHRGVAHANARSHPTRRPVGERRGRRDLFSQAKDARLNGRAHPMVLPAGRGASASLSTPPSR